mmetsp:Transcript_101179/g.326002  ORF Transcript_101179/g.326002 Transcript_101179/m.326002 type:complete len:102 (-) Transcript_101179:304-609(-)
MVLNSIEDTVPSKTGIFDDSTMLDHFLRLHNFLVVMVPNQDLEARSRTKEPSIVIKLFSQTCGHLGLLNRQACRCPLKHGGGNDVLASKARSTMEIKEACG